MKKRVTGILLSIMLVMAILVGCSAKPETSTDTDATTGNETIGADIEVSKESTENIQVEGDYSGTDITVFIFASMKNRFISL